MFDTLAAPSCFVGVIDPRIVSLLKGTVLSLNWLAIGQWVLIGILALGLYTYFAAKLWKWFLDSRDSRTSYEKWLDRKMDEKEEAQYWAEHQRKKKEKREKHD